MGDLYGVSRRRLIGESSFWIAIIIALIILVTLGALGWRYVIAGPKGAVGAKEIQQGALNRVQKQEQFEQLAADYDGYLVKIRAAKLAVASASETDREFRQTELVGIRQVCVDAAQQFNAESRKYSSRVWKSAGLPVTLDPEGCLS
jgi:hypothetical protein